MAGTIAGPERRESDRLAEGAHRGNPATAAGSAGRAGDRLAGGSPGRPQVARGTLLAWLGGAAALSVAVALAAPVAPPAVLGTALFVGLVAAGRWLLGVQLSGHGRVGPVTGLRRELDVTRQQYQRLFSAVPEFICVLDREHNIVEANDAYRQTFGADTRSLCYQVCKRRATKCPNCVVDRTFEDGVPQTEEEILITRWGRRINALVHTQPIFDQDLNVNEVMEVFTDVTEVKRLQRQLALTGRAVAGTAHRIKNILMGLEGGIFIVNEGLETDDREAVASGWEMVERNVHRVAAIVRDLLFCAKERSPEFEPDVLPQDIVREVRDLYADRMAGDDVDIHAELPLPHHRGSFDREAIHNLLCNLVANAIDACRFDPSEHKDGHRVVLRCWHNGDGHTIFQVEDDGEGIPEELTRKVFNEFFSSKGTEGTGIGLLVVQKIAEEHGGTVTFDSRPGEGTVFTVAIPTARPFRTAGGGDGLVAKGPLSGDPTAV
ncbi:MAG: ATP-binding protein [Thermoanaerobaculales bacterium]|jgi:PAS domain S-box-containing protein|nr:ATP-binding protein [Thermoanaerobaculales bacterium]